MATVAMLPFAKVPKGYNKESRERSSNTKPPTRSMTHPLHDPAKASKPRRVKNGEPFDPEELTRRLTIYVAEQKAASQRRREARAAKERAAAIAAGIPVSPTDATYHHIPTVAAAAFQRTATPNIVTADTVHKLAAPVLKAALSPSNPDDSSQNHGSTALGRERSVKMTALQQTLRHDAEEMEKERVRNRNQFQRTRGIEEAAEIDEMRDVYRAPQRTFGEFAHLRRAGKGHSRPLSTGDVFSDSEGTDGIERIGVGSRKKLEIKTKGPGLDYGGRNDWAQEEAVKSPKSPEGEGGKGRTVMERVSGLRRKESIWVLMGKKEKTKAEDGAGNGGGGGVEECMSPPPMDGKKGFLARFKRHPS